MVSRLWQGDCQAINVLCLGCIVRSLSRDHKPDDPEESKVILANNGRIDSYRDQLGN